MKDLNKIFIQNLKNISNQAGDITKILSAKDENYKGFGEIYTSCINKGSIKAWKYHKKMTLNLRVLLGEVKFVFYDGNQSFKEYIFSANDFTLITVPPKIWYGFKSSNCEDSLILNLTDLLFNEKEILRKQIHEIGYDW